MMLACFDLIRDKKVVGEIIEIGGKKRVFIKEKCKDGYTHWRIVG